MQPEQAMAKLLVEKGADILKVGRAIPHALAAGRVSVLMYLRKEEDNLPEEKPARPPRTHCKVC